MNSLRVQEIAEHAVCSKIIVSMIRECIRDCTTPEYSRLSRLWKSRQQPETQGPQAANHQQLAKIICNFIHDFDIKGGFSPSEDEIKDILDGSSNRLMEEKRKSTLSVSASAGSASEPAALQQEQQHTSTVSCCFRGQTAENKPVATDGNSNIDLDTLDSRLKREWNTANLFTGAENGFLPYWTDLQLEVLFGGHRSKYLNPNIHISRTLQCFTV